MFWTDTYDEFRHFAGEFTYASVVSPDSANDNALYREDARDGTFPDEADGSSTVGPLVSQAGGPTLMDDPRHTDVAEAY